MERNTEKERGKRGRWIERKRKRGWWNRREGDRLKVVAINQMKAGDKFFVIN